jgi:hypothetical protein
MADLINIPASVYRAFKVLPMQKGHAQAQFRYAEYVRLGVTAYDFTLTYCDGFSLIRCAWPKPKDMGNAFEGYFAYLTKAEFQRLEYEPKKGASFPLDVRECPFQRDILSPTAVQTFFDITAPKTDKIELTKRINPKILQTVTKALATICSKGERDGSDSTCTVDIGASSDTPLKIRSYVHRYDMNVDAIIMPVRM